MPNRAARRNGSEGSDATIKITTGGNTYEMQFGDFSALDEFDYYQKTGQTLTDVFMAGKISTFAIAGLLWLYRRPYEDGLTFEDVAKGLKFSDLESMEINSNEDEEPAAAPEVVASDPEV